MSQRQPVYRRPSWAQNDTSYKIYMRKDLAADRSPGHDYGMENFSYDPAHLAQWHAPENLAQGLPDTFRNAVVDWQYAGAAVCTALERIKRLDNESLHRGYPDKTRSPDYLSRRPSVASPAVFGGDTPPTGSPSSPAPVMPSGLLPIDKLSFEGLPRRQIIGMESPPFTPTGSQTCPTPDIPNMEKGSIPPSAMPDAHQLSRQLSPISMLSRGDSMSSSSGMPGTPAFDENAWESFLNFYKANLTDARHQALPRFKGCGYIIDRMRVEFGQNREYYDVLEDFNKWWSDMKIKVHEYEEKVRKLHEPTIELIRMERMAQGLPV